jgi:hypothetical protein
VRLRVNVLETVGFGDFINNEARYAPRAPTACGPCVRVCVCLSLGRRGCMAC